MNNTIEDKTSISLTGYSLVLLSLVNFILTPVYTSLFGIHELIISVLNYTFIILASIAICQGRKIARIYYILGLIVILITWFDVCVPEIQFFEVLKHLGLFILFLGLFALLLRNLIKLPSSNVHGILGAISGFIFLGIIGGIVFDAVGYFDSTAFNGISEHKSFDYIYFSFSCITTTGFGDIVPISSIARSLTVLISIAGQFYLAVVVALFVGKYLGEQLKK